MSQWFKSKKLNFIAKRKTAKNTPNRKKTGEIKEVKTTRLGAALLTLMIIFGVLVCEWIVEDLKDLVKPIAPILIETQKYTIKPLDSLVEEWETNLKEKDEAAIRKLHLPKRGGNNTSLDRENFGIHSRNLALVPKTAELYTKFTAIAPRLYDFNSNEYEMQEIEKRLDDIKEMALLYQIPSNLNLDDLLTGKSSLGQLNVKIPAESQRKAHAIALEQVDEKIPPLVELINTTKEYHRELEERASFRLTEIEALKPHIKELASLLKAWNKQYDRLRISEEIKEMALFFLFVAPLFALSLYFYFKLKNRDSPYTIILTAITIIFAILFFQLILTVLFTFFFGNLFLIFIAFIRSISVLRYISYYVIATLVIATFALIVFFIQKNVFNPKRITIRRLREKTCPSCSFTLSLKEDYCPNCGLKIQAPCSLCQQKTLCHLPYCTHCGGSQE